MIASQDFFSWYSKLVVHVHNRYHLCLSYLACFKTLFLVLTLFLPHFPGYSCTLIDIYLQVLQFSNHQGTFSSQPQYLLVWLKFFSFLSYSPLAFFRFASLSPQQCNVFVRNIYQLHISFEFTSNCIAFVLHKLLAY